jgi:hypothetical protein
MIKLKSLTNVRPKKDFGTQIILAPTPGTIKVTPETSKLLKVSAGDYLGVVVDEEGAKYAGFVYKGSEETFGAKLAATNKGGGGVLNCSVANAWAELKGDANYNVHYDVIETPIELSDEEKEANPEFAGFTLYPISFNKKEEKIKRGKAKGQAKKTEVPITDADSDDSLAEDLVGAESEGDDAFDVL